MSLQVVIPFCDHDREQAAILLRWIAELGKVNAVCNLLTANVGKLLPIASQAFSEVCVIDDFEKVSSEWSTGDMDKPRSAAGPNSLFHQAAWHFYVKGHDWLWLEPDCYPVRRDWFSDIQNEYQNCGKPFMGALVRGQTVPDHMSGIGVYPRNTTDNVGLMRCVNVPFDVAAPKEVNPNAHFTKRIVHEFRPPSFTCIEDLDARVPVGASIYHSCKDGSIIPFLRERLFGVVAERFNADTGKIGAGVATGSAGDSRLAHASTCEQVTVPTGGSTPPRALTIKEKSVPETWIGQVRALTRALESMAHTQSHKAQIQAELKKAGLIPRKLRR